MARDDQAVYSLAATGTFNIVQRMTAASSLLSMVPKCNIVNHISAFGGERNG